MMNKMIHTVLILLFSFKGFNSCTTGIEDPVTELPTSENFYAQDWSPDGEWIVYTETYNTGRLWLMRPDGSGKQQLTIE